MKKMINLCRELVKIAKQFCASQNIFDYQNTVTNQLFLLYCFSGKIYFTKKIHQQVKYFWYLVITSQVVFAYVMTADYLLFGSNRDIVMIFNVVNAFGVIHIQVFIFPFILHLFGDGIETMIEQVDNMFTPKTDPKGFRERKVIIDAKKYFGLFLIPFVATFAVYLFACILDMVFFFEQDKATNYLYYAFPPPLLQRYSDHFEWFFVVGCFTSVIFLVMMFEVWCIFSLMLYLCIIFRNELTSIRNYLDNTTCRLNELVERGEYVDSWNGSFEYALEHSAKEFQKTTRLINHLRGPVEAVGTIYILAAFCYGVALLHVGFAGDLPFVLKVKCSMGYLATAVTVVLFYHMGQSLNNSVYEMSLAVYSTPWYESVTVRKHVYVLLCQTQSMKNFAIFKVYGLLFNNFSRYLHGLVSYTNILRRLTNK